MRTTIVIGGTLLGGAVGFALHKLALSAGGG